MSILIWICVVVTVLLPVFLAPSQAQAAPPAVQRPGRKPPLRRERAHALPAPRLLAQQTTVVLLSGGGRTTRWLALHATSRRSPGRRD